MRTVESNFAAMLRIWRPLRILTNTRRDRRVLRGVPFRHDQQRPVDVVVDDCGRRPSALSHADLVVERAGPALPHPRRPGDQGNPRLRELPMVVPGNIIVGAGVDVLGLLCEDGGCCGDRVAQGFAGVWRIRNLMVEGGGG